MVGDVADRNAAACCAALSSSRKAEAARSLLNAIVGSRTAKRVYVVAGAPVALVDALRVTSPRPEAAPIAAALGSFSCSYEDGAQAVVNCGAPAALAESLFAADISLVQAVTRTLKVLLQSDVARYAVCQALLPGMQDAPCARMEEFQSEEQAENTLQATKVAVADEPPAPARIVALMSDPDMNLSEICARIIERICVNRKIVAAFERAGAVAGLVRLLRLSRHEPTLRGAISALSVLSNENSALSTQLANEGVTALVMPFIRSPSSEMRLLTARLLANTSFAYSGGLDTSPVHYRALSSLVLELVQLLRREAPGQVRLDAARVLSGLLYNSEKLQQLACEAGAISFLAQFLDVDERPAKSCKMQSRYRVMPTALSSRGFDYVGLREFGRHSEDTTVNEDHFPYEIRESHDAIELCSLEGAQVDRVEAALDCFAAICSLWDPSREACIRARILPSVLVALEHSNTTVVISALRCIRSLSRSVKIVRRELGLVNIAVPLMRLIRKDSISVKRHASACICNIVVEFSPLRQTVLSDDGIASIASLLLSNDTDIRLNAIRSLKNLTFGAELDVVQSVIVHVSRDRLFELCEDENIRVREQAYGLIRNLTQPCFNQCTERDISILHESIADRMVRLLSESLKPHSPPGVVEQALYVTCNITSGSEGQKSLVMMSELPELMLEWTKHNDVRIRIAAVWCITNLCWKELPDGDPDLPLMQHLSGISQVNGVLRWYRRRELVEGINASTNAFDSPDCPTTSSEDNVHFPSLISIPNDTNIAAEDASSAEFRRVVSNDQDETMHDVFLEDGNSKFPAGGFAWRIRRLRELGFESRLRGMLEDKHIDVVGRVRVALEQFGEFSPNVPAASSPLGAATRSSIVVNSFPGTDSSD